VGVRRKQKESNREGNNSRELRKKSQDGWPPLDNHACREGKNGVTLGYKKGRLEETLQRVREN